MSMHRPETWYRIKYVNGKWHEHQQNKLQNFPSWLREGKNMHDDDGNNDICCFSAFLLPLAFPLFISAWIFNKMPHIHIVVAFNANIVLTRSCYDFFFSRAETYFALMLLLLLLSEQHSWCSLFRIYYHDNGLALGRAPHVQLEAQVAGLELSMNTFILTMF